MTAAPHASHETRLPGWLAGLCLLGATSYQLLCARQDVTFLNEHVLRMDDAYYYFQAARNIADLGWVTFDGIHATSGLQVLWGAALSAMAWLVHDRLAFIRGVLILCAMLNGVAGLILWRLGRNLYSADVGSVAVILWSGFMAGLSPTMIGVEYPLQIVVVLAVLSVWWAIWSDARRATYGQLHLLGILLTVNYWNRLDSASLSLFVALATCGSLVRAGGLSGKFPRQAAALLLWPALGAAGYVAVCLAVAHTPMPLSGMVKTFYARRHFVEYSWLTSLAGHVSWWVRVEIRPMLDAVSTEVLANHRPLVSFLPLAVLAAVTAATGLSLTSIARERSQDRQRYLATRFLAVLWVFGALHAAVVVATIGPFSHVTQHYYGWLLATWCLWGGLIVERWLSRSPSASPSRLLAFGVVACLIAVNAFVAWQRLARPVDVTATLHNRRLPAIAWIQEHVPADARMGAWNAGQIGYFSGRTVVNLDGLANDRDYFTFLESGAPLVDYLRREGITYLVDNDALDLTMPYRAAWDHGKFFHRTVPWTDLETVYVEPGQPEPIRVLRVRSSVRGKPSRDGTIGHR